MNTSQVPWSMVALAALGALLAQIGFTAWGLAPTLGFDDANITMNYAENIAQGHGYVYYVGGERVEGSTSPLWTAVVALGYLLPLPIGVWLTGLGLVIAGGVVALTLALTRRAALAAGQVGAAPLWIAAAAVLFFPGLVSWIVWSFMDTGIWVLIVTGFLSTGLGLILGLSRRGWLLALLGALAVLARPEGVAVALAWPALVAMAGGARLIRPALAAAGLALAVFAGLLAVRYGYFGALQPNTFYAKVSISYGAQAVQGLEYLVKFLKEPINLLLSILVLLAPATTFGREGAARPVWAVLFAFVLGGMAIYVALGGDHFGSFRFFTVLMPAMIALASVVLADLARRAAALHRGLPLAGGLGLAAVLVGIWMDFAEHKGLLLYENRLADRGRDLGQRLNALPGRPTIAVIPAGGVSLTYEGPIYDLMGLNWTEMARADRDHTGALKNHGGFSRRVFYETLPQLVDPILLECDRALYLSSYWRNTALKDLFFDDEFQAAYGFACHDGAAFFLRRDYAQAQGIDLLP